MGGGRIICAGGEGQGLIGYTRTSCDKNMDCKSSKCLVLGVLVVTLPVVSYLCRPGGGVFRVADKGVMERQCGVLGKADHG